MSSACSAARTWLLPNDGGVAVEECMHAEIAGAGFAGLVAAIALRQRGWTARVHEIDTELRAFGAGIFIWDNGLRVLQAIGAYDDVADGAYAAPGYRTERNGVCMSFAKVNAEGHFRLLTMSRQHLYSAILAAARRAESSWRRARAPSAPRRTACFIWPTGAACRPTW